MHPIKILSILSFVLFSSMATGQHFQLNGRVSVLNSRVDNGPIKYLKEVIIKSELSPDKITDYKGRFELNFTNQNSKSTINLEVEKEGYEVVNADVLKNIYFSNGINNI